MSRPEAGPSLNRQATGLGQVRRRAVFYISGFDPQGPGYYYRLFCEQAERQTQGADYQLHIGPRTSDGRLRSTWPVQYTDAAGAVVQSDYHFLRWDDIVRQHWPRGRWRLFLLTTLTSWRIFRNGSWWSMCRASRVAGLTLALPILLVCFALMLAAVSIGLAASWAITTHHGIVSALAHVVGLAAVGVALAKWPGTWRRMQGDWLMRSTASLLKMANDQAPEVEERISAWSELIAGAMGNTEFDEVLVVAHSSGCMGAVAALSRALNLSAAKAGDGRRVSFLTLGQCIPVLSHQPEARAFRTELDHLGTHQSVDWVDVTAPPDACCFALINPLSHPYQPTASAVPSPVKRLSPRYAEQLTPESYQVIKKDKLRCHFQYLMAFDKPTHYGFFSWVCGPRNLMATTQDFRSVTQFTRFSLRFFALHRIKPHHPPLVRVPVNSFEFQPCGRTPQAVNFTR
ncbi:MAG: hypothetical protein C4K60_02605 [Ideonella sp. MAG2]|nr:MAG: hypothetical protein C4K60_02605 [Ideonella sp. MAG2]